VPCPGDAQLAGRLHLLDHGAGARLANAGQLPQHAARKHPAGVHVGDPGQALHPRLRRRVQQRSKNLPEIRIIEAFTARDATR